MLICMYLGGGQLQNSSLGSDTINWIRAVFAWRFSRAAFIPQGSVQLLDGQIKTSVELEGMNRAFNQAFL